MDGWMDGWDHVLSGGGFCGRSVESKAPHEYTRLGWTDGAKGKGKGKA